jgi:competence transcription factor ComK
MIVFLTNKNFQIQISFHRLIEQYIKRIEERNKKKKKTTEHTREIRERKENIFYINPSFLKLIFSYHSKSLIENQISLNTF